MAGVDDVNGKLVVPAQKMAEFDLEGKLVVPAHPLLIEKVFTNITKYLAYPDMVRCGKVCKAWFVIVNPILRARNSLSICAALAPGKDLSLVKSALEKTFGLSFISICCANSELMGELFVLFEHPKAQYLSNLGFVKSKLSPDAFQTLLLKFGHKLQGLEISMLESNSMPMYYPFPISTAGTGVGTSNANKKSFGKREIKIFPDMKKFHLTSFGNVTSTINGICISFPNLVDLTVNGIVIPNENKTPGCNLSLPHLKKLTLGLHDTYTSRWNDLIYHFINMKCKLVELQLINVCKNVNMKKLKMLVQGQADSLESFILMSAARATDPDYAQTEANKSFDMPKLLKLKKLYLDGYYVQNVAKTLKPLPNIERVEFEIYCLEKWIKILPSPTADINPILSVKTLFVENEIGPIEFRTLCKLFPTTEILHLDNCDDEELKILCTELIGLKNLTINGKHGEISDVGFLGISMADCEKLREKDADALELVQNASPSIRDLKNLEQLSIVCCHQTEVSELTFIYGIPQLENLKVLSCGQIQITMETHDAFTQKGFILCEIALAKPTNAIFSFKYVKSVPDGGHGQGDVNGMGKVDQVADMSDILRQLAVS